MIPEFEIISSPEQFKKFMETSIFKDFINEIDVRIAIFSDQLDDFEHEFTGRDYDMFRGAKRTLSETKEIFIDLMYDKISSIEGKEKVNRYARNKGK